MIKIAVYSLFIFTIACADSKTPHPPAPSNTPPQSIFGILPELDDRPEELRLSEQDIFKLKNILEKHFPESTYNGVTEGGQKCEVKILHASQEDIEGMAILMDIFERGRPSVREARLTLRFSNRLAVDVLLTVQSSRRLEFELLEGVKDDEGIYHAKLTYLSSFYEEVGKPQAVYLFDQKAVGESISNAVCEFNH